MADLESQTTYKATVQEEAHGIFHKGNRPVTLKVFWLKRIASS